MQHYNQPAVGEAVSELISAGLVSRGSLWLQTKFTSLDGQDLSQPLPYDANAPLDVQVKQSLESSLRELQTDYIDSLVMHSPMRTLEATMDVWRVFEDLVRSGRVRHLGISNLYTPAALDAVIRLADIKPSFLYASFSFSCWGASRDFSTILELSFSNGGIAGKTDSSPRPTGIGTCCESASNTPSDISRSGP